MAGALQVSHCHQGNQAPRVQARRGGIEPTVKGHRSATEAVSQGLRIRDLLHKATRTEHAKGVSAFRHAGGIIGIVAGRRDWSRRELEDCWPPEHTSLRGTAWIPTHFRVFVPVVRPGPAWRTTP